MRPLNCAAPVKKKPPSHKWPADPGAQYRRALNKSFGNYRKLRLNSGGGKSALALK
jgi:hypothetical protein